MKINWRRIFVVRNVPVRSWHMLLTLTGISMFQNIARVMRVLPLLRKATKTDSVIVRTPLSGVILNFGLYLIAGHVIGSLWYVGSLHVASTCWNQACSGKTNSNNCSTEDLYCMVGKQYNHASNKSSVLSMCSPFEPEKSTYDYGIFGAALSLQKHTDIFEKLFYCFVWGLRNLSSFGQNLETSNINVMENLFVVFISISGLILFSILAGNIQRCVQSVSVRVDEKVVKEQDYEHWMSRIKLPLDLRERVREHNRNEWLMDRGVDEESLIRNLSNDLRRDIKRHKYRSLRI